MNHVTRCEDVRVWGVGRMHVALCVCVCGGAPAGAPGCLAECVCVWGGGAWVHGWVCACVCVWGGAWVHG